MKCDGAGIQPAPPGAMHLTIHLHTVYQIQSAGGPIGRLELDLPAGSTLGDLLAQLQIKPEPDTVLLVINGKLAELENSLAEGDLVDVIPAISGGSA